MKRGSEVLFWTVMRSARRGSLRAKIFVMIGLPVLVLSGCAGQGGYDEGADKGPPGSQPKSGERIDHRKVRITKRMPFETDIVETARLAAGQREVQQAGEVGLLVRVVRLSVRSGEVIDRQLVRKFVAREPVDRVVLVGTRVEPKREPDPLPGRVGDCDPNYSGACVPVASDVDCAGG